MAPDYTQRMAHPSETRRGPEPPDISEKGGMKHGQPQRSDVRLFMQFLAFGGAQGIGTAGSLGKSLEAAGIPGVVYEDINDPRGLGILTFSEDPGFFLDQLRPLLSAHTSNLKQKPEYTMLGRTYALGYEPGRGVLISAVEPDSPAAEAGVERGLVIYRVSKHDVNSIKDVENLLGRAKSGTNVDFVVGVVRSGGDGQRVATVSLTAR